MQDGVLPGDHKFNLDDDDVRDSKKTRGTTADTSQRSTGSGFGGAARGGSAWSGFGGGRGGASGGGEGEPPRRRAVVGGMRRIAGTKQQALRKNGVFKIAPQSKVLKKKTRFVTSGLLFDSDGCKEKCYNVSCRGCIDIKRGT